MKEWKEKSQLADLFSTMSLNIGKIKPISTFAQRVNYYNHWSAKTKRAKRRKSDPGSEWSVWSYRTIYYTLLGSCFIDKNKGKYRKVPSNALISGETSAPILFLFHLENSFQYVLKTAKGCLLLKKLKRLGQKKTNKNKRPSKFRLCHSIHHQET